MSERVVDSKAEAREPKVWIFQGNPLVYEVYNSLLELDAAAWLVTRFEDEIKIGDIAIIWKARDRCGIYAVGKVASDPQEMSDLDESLKYWIYPSQGIKKALRVKVHYEQKFRLTNALLSKELYRISELRKMDIFTLRQGTNFKVSPAEWEIIRQLLKQR